MLLTFRTLGGKKYIFDVDPSASISDIDFSSEIPNISPETKFIFKGTYLDYSTPISSLSLSPNDFIVISNPVQIHHYPRQEKNGDPNSCKQALDEPSVAPLPHIFRSFANDRRYEMMVGLPQIIAMSNHQDPRAVQALLEIIRSEQLDRDLYVHTHEEEEEEDFEDLSNHTNSQRDTTEQQNDQNSNEQPNQLEQSPPPETDLYEFAGIEGSENFTAHDKEIIHRLHEMTPHINLSMIAQVFIACNKEENLTAECLLKGSF